MTSTTPARSVGPTALLSPAEVSRYLGVPVATLANWRYQGRGPAFLRVGRHVRYRPGDLEAWVEAQLSLNASLPQGEPNSIPHLRSATK